MPDDMPRLGGGSNKKLPARPQLDRGFTSFHTAQDSLSDEDEFNPPIGQERPDGNIREPQTLQRVSPLRSGYDGQNNSTDYTPDTFELPTLSNRAKQQHGLGHSNGPAPHRFQVDPGSDLDGADHALPQDVHTLRTIVEELREELRDVSVELATSIQREMDLEDGMDRLNAALQTGSDEGNRRTSDYFSESSGSSARLSGTQGESRIEGLEKMRRKAEQEKAQMRRDLAHRLEQDLAQRREFELHRQSLESQLRTQQDTQDTLETMTQKAKDFEAALGEARRRLVDEQQIRENIEKLFNGLQQDTSSNKGRSGNDATVAELRSQIKSLESDATRAQQLSLENARLHRELDSMKVEQTARQRSPTKRTEVVMNDLTKDELPMSPKASAFGLTRNTSTVRRRSVRQGSISSDIATPESHVETLKHIEEQRDALQNTLKNLVRRYDQQEHHHSKQMRALQRELDRAMNRDPKRISLNSEVQNLRSEVKQLRECADEVLEQKWQCEKGLSGLRIDMDRTQQETSKLRETLAAFQSMKAGHADAASLALNDDLRHRIQDAIHRAEAEQSAATRRVAELLDNLKSGEERLLAAQNMSDEIVEQQEQLVKDLGDSRREIANRGVTRSSLSKSRHTAALPMSPDPQTRTPRLPANETFSLGMKPLKMKKLRIGEPDPAKTQAFKVCVQSLEKEAETTDQQIRDIVGKMARAQAEAVGLQAEW